MRISDWSSDVCSSDLPPHSPGAAAAAARLQDMFSTDSLSGSKPEQYAQLARQARALVAGERDRIANAANLSALVYHALPRPNWGGFYFFDGNELVESGRASCRERGCRYG